MFIPEFRNEEEVWQFVDLKSDAWCYPMVEEYLDLIHINEDPIDLDELNGWIEHEMKSATEGYEEWVKENDYE
jgi:hypothetical protein|tara:strand:- start:284 stop:502 length:219 start_codon:yes stop_codon:yes gene_type:complete